MTYTQVSANQPPAAGGAQASTNQASGPVDRSPVGDGFVTDGAALQAMKRLEINMTESASAQNVPAEPYTVTDVGGHVPVLLDDFVGATTVSVKGDDREYRLRGAGRKVGRAVEFHEKEPASAAAETPVWMIIEERDGNIVAEPPAS